MKKKELITEYTQGPLFRQMLGFAWPFILSYLLQTLYNLADMAVVGHFVGSAGLSAVSVGGDLIQLYTFVVLGFCNAGQILISQYIGMKDRNSLGTVIIALAKLLFVSAVLVTAAGLVFADRIVLWLKVPEEAKTQCLEYAMCCTGGTIFIYGYNMVSAVLRGMGDSKRPLVFIAVASVLNVLLDILFVSGGMGAFGAALATVIAQGVSFALSLVYLYRNRQHLGFSFQTGGRAEEKRLITVLLKLGIPLILQNSAVSVSGLLVTSYVNSFGLTASAVTGVGAKLVTLTFVVSVGIMQASGAMVGQNFAAKQFDRVKKIFLFGGALTITAATFLSVWMILCPEWVFSLFSSDPEVLTASAAYAPVAVLNFYGAALRAPSVALCTGIGNTKMNLFLGLLDGIGMRLGLCFFLSFVMEMGIQGFWYGSALSSFVYILVVLPYFLSGKWQHRAPPAI